jgi:hypothetical protein
LGHRNCATLLLEDNPDVVVGRKSTNRGLSIVPLRNNLLDNECGLVAAVAMAGGVVGVVTVLQY